LAGLMAVSVISCLTWREGFGWPRETLAPLLAPLSHGLTYAAGGIRCNVRDLLGAPLDDETARRLLADNEAMRRELMRYVDDTLRRQVVFYQQQYAEQQQQLAEMGRWRQAFEDDFPCMLIPATVIAYGPTPYQRVSRVRTGKRVGKGQFVTTRSLLTNRPTAIPGAPRAVLSGAAMVGQIVASGAWTAQLQLLTDPDFHVQAFVKRVYDPRKQRKIVVDEVVGDKVVPVTRPLGPDDAMIPVNLTGDLERMVSTAVPGQQGLEVGDYVVTMGLDARLPVGIFIGTVSAVRVVPDNPKHVTLEVKPAAELELLREVYVVVPLVRGG